MPKRSYPKSIPSFDTLSDWATLDEAKAILRIGGVELTNLLKHGEDPSRRFDRRIRIPKEALRP